MSKDTEAQILKCIENDDYRGLMQLKVKSGLTVTYRVTDKNETSSLQFACAVHNAFECFVYLTQKLYDFDAKDSKGLRPIHSAAEYGATEVFSYILNIYKRKGMLNSFFEQEKHKGEYTSKVLYKAASRGILDIYKVYSDYGFDFAYLAQENKSLLHEICKKLSSNPQNDPDTIIFFLKQIESFENLASNEKTALMTAVIHALDEKVVSILVKHINVNAVDSDNRTAFEYACFHNNLAAAKILIQKDISASFDTKGFMSICKLRDPYVGKIAFERYGEKMKGQFYTEVDGSYPIKEALNEDKTDKLIEFLKILLENDYDPDARSHPTCPTMFEAILASPFPRPELIEFLLKNNVRLDTPFHGKPGGCPKDYLRKSYNPSIVAIRNKHQIK
ncbi:hypothetical protein TVAG_404330 [Trichomonas vaginalis G3]|uniref:Uncharacterized protein n=1 Tax=Trichomonas vaginalis (strain ATCC PRA-98 / G3) TaxID=412133 RepID=A2EGI2_TRIV3|nr:Ankyrin repeat family [Trichomonas vaginalis G3]EAY08265.1 hypothetical protein TVAG_404330 [Trichomonas vaginalis G3]KAI5507493.1 Ankyrin repeat family [Trichomonas vaginalis G3]|eukprot:XP_001320488.1 hypothetical protein [Trichomonas vaginalis G3]